MLIECTAKRPLDEPIVVPIGNEKYSFEPDAYGRRVAEVWIEKHIECFLACSHLYRAVPEVPGAAGGSSFSTVSEATDHPPSQDGHAPIPMKRHAMMKLLSQRGVVYNTRAGNAELWQAVVRSGGQPADAEHAAP